MRLADRFLDPHDLPPGCSVLVVGAGMSGLSAALELAQRGESDVIVADHGPFDGFEHRSRTPDPSPLPGLPAPWTSTSAHYAKLSGVVSPVGGRSRCWHGVILPISRAVLDRSWPQDTAARLLGDGPGSYRALESDLADWCAEHVTDSPEGTDDDPRAELRTFWPDLALTPAPQAGRHSDGPEGRIVWSYSPLLSWAGRGFTRHTTPRLPRVAPDLRAIRVLVEDGRACGVLFATPDGGARRVRADTVVLAAGTLENTRLHAQAVGDAGEIRTRWPGLNDHVTHGYAVPLPAGLAGRWARSGRRLLWSDHEARHNGNLFMEVHAAGLGGPVLDLWWMAQQETPFADEIHFTPDEDTATPWAARIEAALSTADLAAVRRRDALAAQLITALGVSPPSPDSHAGFDDFEPAAHAALASGLATHYVAELGTADHEAGTVPLGKHLDFGGRSGAVDGLFVTGPATFPAAGAANPSLTILALAAHTAEAVVEGRR